MIVDTASLAPEMKGIFEVRSIPEEENRRNTIFWNFEFNVETSTGETTIYSESVPVWLVGPIFRALQFPEVSSGRFDVEAPLALGRKIKGRVVHEKITSGRKAGTIVARLKEVTAWSEGEKSASTKISPEDDIPF